MKKYCVGLLCLFFFLGACTKSPVSKYNRLDGTTWVPATVEQTGLGGFGGFFSSLQFLDNKFKLNLSVASLVGIPGLVVTGTYSRSGDKLQFIFDDFEYISVSGEFFGDDSIVLAISFDNVNYANDSSPSQGGRPLRSLPNNILKVEFIKEK